MRNDACEHIGHRVYARRIFKNGTTHYCVQCQECYQVVKMPEHDFRVWIRHDEIPASKMIHPFIEAHNND